MLRTGVSFVCALLLDRVRAQEAAELASFFCSLSSSLSVASWCVSSGRTACSLLSSLSVLVWLASLVRSQRATRGAGPRRRNL